MRAVLNKKMKSKKIKKVDFGRIFLQKTVKKLHKEPKNGLTNEKYKNICVDKVENGGIMKP